MTARDRNQLMVIGRKVKEWQASSAKGRRWPEDLIEEIVSLRREGYSLSDLERVTGIYCSTISRWCQKTGRHKEKAFTELAVVPGQRLLSKAASDVLLHTARGHCARMGLSDLCFLFEAGVL